MSPSGGQEEIKLFAYLEQIQSIKRQLYPIQQRVNRSEEPADSVVSVAAIFRNNPAYRTYQRKLSQQSTFTTTTPSGSGTTAVDVVKPRATVLTMPDCPLLLASPASSDRTTPAAIEAAVAEQQRRTKKRIRAAKENLNLRESDMKRRKKRL